MLIEIRDYGSENDSVQVTTVGVKPVHHQGGSISTTKGILSKLLNQEQRLQINVSNVTASVSSILPVGYLSCPCYVLHLCCIAVF